MAGQRVHVAFDHDGLSGFPDRLPGLSQRVQRLPLREEEGLARVQVLRGAVVEDAAPKRHRPPLQVVDRKDHPIPERIVMPPARRPRHGQPRLLEGGGVEPPGVERPDQVVPARRGEPEPEGVLDRRVDPARGQVAAGAFPGGSPELRLKERGRLRHDPQQPLALAGRLLIARRPLQPDPRPLGQFLPGLREGERPGAHDEVEDVSAGVTAEAVEEAAVRIDGERRGLLRMEGAEALVVAPGPAQGDVRGHDV